MNYEWTEKNISIGEIKDLLKDYEVEIDSPDGWVGVNFFIDKGEWDEYVLKTDNGLEVKCNENHLFKTNMGWISAKNMINKDSLWIVNTNKGESVATVNKTENKIPIVDINVNHENHRYYTNGVESHNTGVGKSLFMCHCASANLFDGLNVLYITMEMSEEKIAERIDANMLDVRIDELIDIPKDVYDKKVNRLKNKTKGKLIIKEYPTACAGSANFRHLINELKIKRNFIPDIIYIDYLNICISSRLKQSSNVNSYTYIKAIAEELRGLAVEFNVPIVSATQTTRSGFASSDLGLEDTSESFGLPATADFMFAIISTEELAELNQIMVKQLKNRYSDPSVNKRFVIGVDKGKMKLYDVEQEAQEDILDGPVFDNSEFGTEENERSKPKSKFDKNKFRGFK
jgi:hypothetical protein